MDSTTGAEEIIGCFFVSSGLSCLCLWWMGEAFVAVFASYLIGTGDPVLALIYFISMPQGALEMNSCGHILITYFT